MSMSHSDLKSRFQKKINEILEEKSAILCGGTCTDYTQYKSLTASIAAYKDAYDLLVDCIKELNSSDEDDE